MRDFDRVFVRKLDANFALQRLFSRAAVWVPLYPFLNRGGRIQGATVWATCDTVLWLTDALPHPTCHDVTGEGAGAQIMGPS